MATAKEDYEMLARLAERLDLDEQKSESFVNSSMKRLGYKPRMDWDEPEEGNDGDGGGSDFFGGGGRQQRNVGGGRGEREQQGGRRGGGDWQYS